MLPTVLLKKVKLKERFVNMAKSPDEIVAEIDRKQNAEDKDLPRRAAKAALDLVKPKMTKPDTGETTNPMGDKYAKGGTASSRADGIAKKGKTRGKIC